MNGLLVPTRILFQVGVQLELVSGQRQQVMLFVPVASFFVNNAAFTIFVFKRSIGPSAFKISIFPLHTGEIHRHFVFGRLPTLQIINAEILIENSMVRSRRISVRISKLFAVTKSLVKSGISGLMRLRVKFKLIAKSSSDICPSRSNTASA